MRFGMFILDPMISIFVSVLVASTPVFSTTGSQSRPMTKLIHQSTQSQNGHFSEIRGSTPFAQNIGHFPSQQRVRREPQVKYGIIRGGNQYRRDTTSRSRLNRGISETNYKMGVETGIEASIVEGLLCMSPSEIQQFTTTFSLARVQGLSKIDAKVFAMRLVFTQILLAVNGFQPGSKVQVQAQAFTTAKTIALAQGMSKEDATQFAGAMVRVQLVKGVQNGSTLSLFALYYAKALLIGKQEGLTRTQATEFASAFLRIQESFGVQGDQVLTTFAQQYKIIWEVAVRQGLTPFEVLRFATVMLQMDARMETMDITTLTSHAQDFLSFVATAVAQGISSIHATLLANDILIARAGFANFFTTGNLY